MALWRTILCDKYGNVLSNLTPIATGRQYTATLNRPAEYVFSVPSSDSRVAGLLDETCTVRAYRYELQADGSSSWAIRFAGHVWIVDDEGDADKMITTVTCYDPFQVLSLRIARRMIWRSDNSSASHAPSGWTLTADTNLFVAGFYAGNSGAYTADDQAFTFKLLDDSGTQSAGPVGSAVVTKNESHIARGLLNATNYFDGFTGLDDYYYSALFNAYKPFTGAQSIPAAALSVPKTSESGISPRFDTSKKVGDWIVDAFAQYNTADFSVVPVDNLYTTHPAPKGNSSDYAGFVTAGGVTTSTYRTLGLLKFHAPTRGTTKPDVVFGFAAPPHNIAALGQTIDRTGLTNHAFGVAKGKTSRATNFPSINRFGVVGFGLVSSLDVTDSVMLKAQVVELANANAYAARALTITPQAGAGCPLPFDRFDVGDYVGVVAGPRFRGGFSESHRVLQYVLTIPDNSVTEVLSQLTVAPQSVGAA